MGDVHASVLGGSKMKINELPNGTYVRACAGSCLELIDVMTRRRVLLEPRIEGVVGRDFAEGRMVLTMKGGPAYYVPFKLPVEVIGGIGKAGMAKVEVLETDGNAFEVRGRPEKGGNGSVFHV